MGIIKIPALQSAVLKAKEINTAIKSKLSQSVMTNTPCETCGKRITKN